jgi:hypothetical protein
MVATTILALGLFTGCAQPRFRAQDYLYNERRTRLVERAAFDLNCPKPQLNTQQLGDEHTMGVAGCGRRATYVFDYGKDSWFLNGIASDDSVGPPGSPLASEAAKPLSSTIPETKSGSTGGMTTP